MTMEDARTAVALALAHRWACDNRLARAAGEHETRAARVALREAKRKHVEAIADLWEVTAASGDHISFARARKDAAALAADLNTAVGMVGAA